MLDLTVLALELLEYKVDEYQRTHQVRGGAGSLWELEAHLSREAGSLTGDLRTRFEAVAQRLRSLNESSRGTAVNTLDINALVLGPSPELELLLEQDDRPAQHDSPDVREEHAVLQRLARSVWWLGLDEFVQKVAAGWRAERERLTARLVYATLQNIRRNGTRKTFAHDVNLRGFAVTEAIPQLTDPLVSLSDVDSLAEILRELINLIMTLGKQGGPYPDLLVPETGALAFVRQAAMLVAQDPYAGKLALHGPSSASSKQLRLAIQEIGKERLPEEQRVANRRDLERRLADALALERSQRQMFQRDSLQFTDLVHVFFERLADYLPTTVGGRASGPQLDGGVLFGHNPALRWESVPPGTNAITVRLVGPVRFTLAQHDIAVMGSGPSQSLFVGEEEIPLQSQMFVDLERSRLHVFHEGSYVHFLYKDEARSLAVRLAEALVVLYVLGHAQRESLLTLLKVLANTVRGEPQDLVARALARASSVSARAPNRNQAVDGLVRGAARASSLDLGENVLLGLVQRLVGAMTVSPNDVAGVMERVPNAVTGLHPLGGEPITVDVAGQKVTVRQYRGRSSESQESIVAMLPGQVLGSFTDYLLVPMNDGTLLLVRGDLELATMFVPDVKIEATRAV